MMNPEKMFSEVSAKRAYELMLSLAHERVSCTGAETEAAERLKAEAEKIGADCRIDNFSSS